MKVNITETVLRDANQSLIATRMPYSDFEGILETLDQAGYYSLECWGGATFDSCLRYLDEDPWDRLEKIKAKVKNTKLQMLLRGQNILGYKHYPDDVVRKFVAQSVESGIDIFRIFDALNDFRNIQVAVDETLKRKAHAQGCICYTTSPIHNLKSYAKMGKQLEKMGVDSVCIKDMAGIMGPQEAFDLIKTLKETIKLPVFLHSHCTTGLGPITYMKAIEAGCDGIDCAISSFSGGTSQPATETMYYALKQMGISTGLNEGVLKKINDYFFLDGILLIFLLISIVFLYKIPLKSRCFWGTAILSVFLTIFIFFNLYLHEYYYIAISAYMSVIVGFGIYSLIKFILPKKNWWIVLSLLFFSFVLMRGVEQYKKFFLGKMNLFTD